MISFFFCVPNSIVLISVVIGWVYLRHKNAFVDTYECGLQLCSMLSFITKVKENFILPSMSNMTTTSKYIKIHYTLGTCRHSQI